MQENDLKKLSPKKLRKSHPEGLRPIPIRVVKSFIQATHDAIDKSGERTKVADIILMLSHAYIELSNAYKDSKKEIAAIAREYNSMHASLSAATSQLENQARDITALKHVNKCLLEKMHALHELQRVNNESGVAQQLESVPGAPKRKPPSVKHSSQAWKPAKPNREEKRRAAAMREKVCAAGDELTEEILSLLGE